MTDTGLRPEADAPIETKVTTAVLDQHGETCAHGFPWVRVDGELWHCESEAEAHVYTACLAPKDAR